MSAPVYIATRGSPLALAQADLVLKQCRAAVPHQAFEIKVIKTTGDRLQIASLASAGLPKGLFTKELEVALLNGEADLAVHSLKDLPTELPPGLTLGAVLQRADVRDVVVYRHVEFIACWPDAAAAVNQGRRGFKPELSVVALPYGATVATSSTRRRAQLLDRRPDLKIVPIRGNVGTRLKKLADQAEIDALVLAAAGLQRLGLEMWSGANLSGANVPPGLASTPLSISEMLPCVGQAAIGIETRDKDPRLEEICARVNHIDTYRCVTAERAFLGAMGGGCQLAVGGYADILDQKLRLRGVSFLTGAGRWGEVRGDVLAPESVGEQLAKELRT